MEVGGQEIGKLVKKVKKNANFWKKKLAKVEMCGIITLVNRSFSSYYDRVS